MQLLSKFMQSKFVQSQLNRTPILHGLVVAACLVIVIAGMRAASYFLSPFLLASFLAILLYPAYRWLLDRGMPTWLTVTVVVLGILLVGGGLLALVWISLAQLRENLFIYTNRIVILRIRLVDWLAGFGIDASTLLNSDLLSRQMLLNSAARLAASLGSLISMGFVVVVATIFLLLQGTHLSSRLEVELGPDSRLRAHALQIGQRVAEYFAIRVRVNLIVAIGITLWLAVLGVDLAVLWGILAFFMSFVMYAGPVIAATPPVLLALAESGMLWAVLVIVGVTAINVAVENVVAPAMMGQGLNLAPVVALASLIFWAWVLGPLGLVLAIPLTVVVVMILASSPETHWLTVFLTMNTRPLPPMLPPLETAAAKDELA
jgi:predicted PurR-regulated permease PerM